MKILKTIWFYARLCLANAAFIAWYGFHQHLSTRTFLISLFGFCFSVLLVAYQVFTWKTDVFTQKQTAVPHLSEISDQIEFSESLYTPDQLNQRSTWLQTMLHNQPSHRDLLLNSVLVEFSSGVQPSAEISNQLKLLDPNHPMVSNLFN